MTIILSVLNMVRMHQHDKFQAIPSMHSPDYAQKPQICPVSLSTKIRKINRPWPKCNQFWRWSGYISMPNFRPFLPWVFQEMPRNFFGMDGWTDRLTDKKKRSVLVRQINGQAERQCTWKTFMIHQTFVRWPLYILFKFVKSLIRQLSLAIGNVWCVQWFWWTLERWSFRLRTERRTIQT